MAKRGSGRRESRRPDGTVRPDIDGIPRVLSATSAGDLSIPRQRTMMEAAATIRDCQRLFTKTGENVVGELLRAESGFLQWNHYPDGDVYDPESHAQYYYHAHPPENRPFAEHGHFHLFLREKGMLAGMRPSAGQAPRSGTDGAICHLIAISMDRYGRPIRLFTTNRWVTGETWYRAGDVVRMLDSFAVDLIRPNLAVNLWITAMVRLFRPQIEALIVERDRVLAAWNARHSDVDPLEDRRLEVMSRMEISLDGQIADLLDRQACGVRA